MNFNLRSLLYASAVVATSLAGFGVGGLFLAATTLAVWRLAFPSDNCLPKWLEYSLAGYVIVSLGVALVFAGVWGLEGWSFDPAEYDPAPQISRFAFLAVALAPILRWTQVNRRPQANTPEEPLELPEDFP